MDVMRVGSSGTWLSCCKEEGNVGKCVFGGLFLLLESEWKLQTHSPNSVQHLSSCVVGL